ncbi:MAG: peptide chain release factor 1 [Geoglossum umbratile]|nr:MAG: peptide chain release factor 1 [Geoglossum umbratile]
MSDHAKGKAASTNPRGIPYAPFVDKVEDYVSSREEVESTLKSFQEMISKYQFMEVNTQRRAAGLKEKLPDIQKTLDTVQFLKTRKAGSEPIEATFELNDTLYAKAHVPPTDEVYLWLGVQEILRDTCMTTTALTLYSQANVMLSYPIPEAESLLESKLSSAKQNLLNCEEDLDFLREQITTLEVATARVYNWDVTQKRKERAALAETAKVGKKKASSAEG